ncbi:MAG: DUF3006 domain-containing protein [Clostridia bacterium]|nr:DUF3006 domain-containing protein [Clostridia bacterium]
MKLIVDRIEEKTVILENEKGELFPVPTAILPPIKAGDVLTIAVDENETEKRRNKIES